MRYLKKASRSAGGDDAEITAAVAKILQDVERGGEQAARDYAVRFDQWEGDIVVAAADRERAVAGLPQKLKDDIAFAHDKVRRFADAQRAAILDTEIELMPGLVAGHRNIPVATAGCYVPGGRYTHLASAIMSVTTAKIAGVQHVIAACPPRPSVGINPAVLYALDFCGADTILNLGGVQAIASLAFGLFTGHRADILVGPGNQYVAEAKRILYGRVGIDMFAGPSEIMIIAGCPNSTPRTRKLPGETTARSSSSIAAKKQPGPPTPTPPSILRCSAPMRNGGSGVYATTVRYSLARRRQLPSGTRRPALTTFCRQRARRVSRAGSP